MMATEDAAMFEIYLIACFGLEPRDGAQCREVSLGTSEICPSAMDVSRAMGQWAMVHQGYRIARFGSRRLGRYVNT